MQPRLVSSDCLLRGLDKAYNPASVKEECLAKLILFGERPLRRALQQYLAHYHEERNHQGKQNRLLFPLPNRGTSGDNGMVRCKERLGGLLKYYEREAA